MARAASSLGPWSDRTSRFLADRGRGQRWGPPPPRVDQNRTSGGIVLRRCEALGGPRGVWTPPPLGAPLKVAWWGSQAGRIVKYGRWAGGIAVVGEKLPTNGRRRAREALAGALLCGASARARGRVAGRLRPMRVSVPGLDGSLPAASGGNVGRSRVGELRSISGEVTGIRPRARIAVRCSTSSHQRAHPRGVCVDVGSWKCGQGRGWAD